LQRAQEVISLSVWGLSRQSVPIIVRSNPDAVLHLRESRAALCLAALLRDIILSPDASGRHRYMAAAALPVRLSREAKLALAVS
jgi:hypothetical protein